MHHPMWMTSAPRERRRPGFGPGGRGTLRRFRRPPLCDPLGCRASLAHPSLPIHHRGAMRADRPLGVAPATALDYRELARRRLPRQLFDYLDGGSCDEATMRANVADLTRVLLRQVVMRGVSVRDPAA